MNPSRYEAQNNFTQTFLLNALKEDLSKLTLVHNGVNCEASSGEVPVPVQRTDKQFVGQTFDVNELPLNATENKILITNSTRKCMENWIACGFPIYKEIKLWYKALQNDAVQM